MHTSSTDAPPSSSPATFHVDAPHLHAGQAWMMRQTVSGTVTVGTHTEPIHGGGYTGATLLTASQTIDGRQGGYALALMSTDGSLDNAEPVGPGLYDLGSGMREPRTLAQLHACQVDPAACPADLSAMAGDPDEMGTLQFPLTPGAHWSTTLAPEGWSGSIDVVVRSMDSLQVEGKQDDAVALDFNGHFTVHDTRDNTTLSGIGDVAGTHWFSARHATVVKTTATLKLDADVTTRYGSTHVVSKESLNAFLSADDSAVQPDLDGVDVYEAFNLLGRSIGVASNVTSGTIHVALTPKEVPTGSLGWRITDPSGYEVQRGNDTVFDVHLATSNATLRIESRHHGHILVTQNAQLTPQGAIPDAPVDQPFHVTGDVPCDAVVLTLPMGLGNGSCPSLPVPLRPGLHNLTILVAANNTIPQGTSATLELVDGAGHVVGEANVTDTGRLVVALPANAGGTWQVRYTPQAALQMDVAFDVTGR